MLDNQTTIYEEKLSQWKRDIREALIFNSIIGLLVGAFAAWMLTLYGPQMGLHLTFAHVFVGMLPLLAVMMIPPVMASAGRRPRPA